MNIVLPTPSLQHLAGVKIVTHLWSRPNILTRIDDLFGHGLVSNLLDEDGRPWKVMEEKVKKKVSSLQISELCKQQLFNLIKPIGVDIIEWFQYHNVQAIDFDYFEALTPNQLRWTMYGTIDLKKTAELMVKDESLDIKNRYAIACVNCLEDEARQLFRKMGKRGRREYLRQLHEKVDSAEEGAMIFYFSYTFNGDVDGLKRHFHVPRVSIINKRLFEEPLCGGTRATCEYFFQKLSQREKEQILEKCEWRSFPHRDYPTSSWMYYWSLLNEEQREGMFRECGSKVLESLLYWPMQPVFMETAQRGWSFMDKDACTQVLKKIIEIINRGRRDYDYSQLFWECWRLCSVEYKQYFLSNKRNIDWLLYTEREEFIRLFFNHAPWNLLQELVRYTGINSVLLDESVISDAALMEYKEKAARDSSSDPGDEDKRWRSKYLGRLVDKVMEKRAKEEDSQSTD